jgi:NAD(P)-dependent dehydrogenase (short-subunit alcohol dehydrogenase family)
LIETHVADVTDDASVEQLFDAVVRTVRSPRTPVQQCRNQRAPGTSRSTQHGSASVDHRDQPLGLVSLRPRCVPRDEGANLARWRIINNGSVSAYAPRPNSAPYTATKHGITGLTKSLVLDGRAFNIACGQIDIGNATTEMSARMATGAMQANGTTMVEPRIPAKLVAEAVVHMANLPLEANIPFVTIMASGMPLYGRG